MLDPNFMVLYVANMKASRDFYVGLLERQPAQETDGFAAFAFESGMMLGLWRRDVVQPPVPPSGVSSEIVFHVADKPAVDALCADWRRRGISIGQEPVDAVFGRTFVGLDPDGYRLRVIASPAQ